MMQRMLSRVTPALVVLLAALSVSAQPGRTEPPFDEVRYRALVAECDAILQRAQATLAGGDPAMAAVFLDLGWSSCQQARQTLARSAAGLDDAVRSALYADSLERALRLTELLVQADECPRAGQVYAETLAIPEAIPSQLVQRAAVVAQAVLRCLPPGGLAADQLVELWGDGAEEWLEGEPRGFVWRDERFATCPGTFSHPPSYRVTVAEPGRVTVELHAPGDWRLAVQGEAGVYCGSGGDGVFWLELDAQAVAYDVFVGWSGASAPRDHYGIGFTLRALAGLGSGPSHGLARLSASQLETRLRGHTIGTDPAAERFGSGCGGYVPAVPNHRLELAEAAEVTVTVASPMSRELTLALLGPDGVRCAEPGVDGATELNAPLEAGEYDLFVGEPSPWGTGYEAHFAVVGGSILTAPRLARLSLPADGPGHTFDGTVPASSTDGQRRSDCVGLFYRMPDVTFEVTESSSWGVMARSPSDTCLVVVGPDQSWCNDDFAGVDPGVFRRFEPGEYQVFVGARATASGFGYQLSIVRD